MHRSHLGNHFCRPNSQNAWSIFIFEGDEDNAPYSYTVGLSAHGLPEILLLFPLEPEISIDILNNVAEVFLQLGKAIAGDLYGVVPGRSIRIQFINLEAFDEFGEAARAWADGHGVSLDTAMQIIIPDRNGVFPNDPNYRWIEQITLPEAIPVFHNQHVSNFMQ
jgi:hypothetical protein